MNEKKSSVRCKSNWVCACLETVQQNVLVMLNVSRLSLVSIDHRELGVTSQ